MDNGLVFNNLNVKNDGANPDPIQVPNAITYKPSIGLSFQHITRYGLMYGAGVQFGSYNHDVDVVYNSFDFLDTFDVLKDDTYKFQYRNSSDYLGIHLFLGYSFRLPSKSSCPVFIDTKLKFTSRFYFSGGFTETYLNSAVMVRDTIFGGYTAVYVNNSWGNNHRNTPNFLDFYIGIRKRIGWHFLSDLNLGAYCTYQFEFPTSARVSASIETEVRNGHYLHGVFQYYSYDYYKNRELTFGIRAGLGFDL